MNHKISASEPFLLDIKPPPGKLQVAAPPQVTVYPGTKNRLMVKISRQEFNDAIEVEVTGMPRGVTFSTLTIPADKTEGEIEVYVDKDIIPGARPPETLTVTAKATDGKDFTASVPMILQIVLPGPTIQMAVSPKVPVYPGGKATFGVKIARNRFDGAVTLTAQPTGKAVAGVKVESITIPEGKSEGEMEVTVPATALGLPLKYSQPLMVVARGVKDKRATGSETVEVEILAPPSDLQLSVPPEVEVYQAGRCQFMIKIARSGFLGPVQLKFNNVPPGVTLAPVTIVGNDLVVKGSATLEAVPKKYDIEAVATGPKAPDGKIPTATKPFTLTVKPFDPSIRPPLDIVFVLDVTNSMDPQIAGVRDGVGEFVKALKDRELEARIAMVAFRDIIYDDVPFEVLKFKGEPFTTDTKAFSVEVGKLKAMGGGDDPESSLDALVLASKQPFRPGALRVLILITDDEPQTKGNSVLMPAALKMLKENKIDQVHLIVKTKHLPKYEALHKVAKGGFFDFETVSKKTKDNPGFVSLLPILSKEIVTTIGAPEPKATAPAQPEAAPTPPPPPGEKTPEPRAELGTNAPRPVVPQPPKSGEASVIESAAPSSPEVEDAPPPVAALPEIQGVQSNQMYAAKDRLWLLIAVALWTAALAGGIALTLTVAQKRYLRQAWPSFGEAGKALGAGMAAGLLAGIIGQWFFESTSGSRVWSEISRLFAWAILGGMIGGGMGLIVPNLKWGRAVLGGCIGGLAGAVGFVLVSMLAGDLLGRWIGAALLGLAIGLMVALAEIAFRRYWLEVRIGREVRTITLGPTVVAVGGDEKLVGVYIPNAPARALGYRVDRERVLCEDFSNGKIGDAPPGDLRTVASAKVKVCSAANAQTIGVNLQLIMAKDVALIEGMPLTSEDVPGLEAQGIDGIVALVSRRPNDPNVFLLRNRSKQPWIVTEASGNQRKVEPGLSIELTSRCEVNFGQVKGTLDPSQAGDRRDS